MPQLAGETILASDIIPVKIYRKVSGTQNTTSATLANDTDLVNIALAANKIFNIRLVAAAVNSTQVNPNGDINTAWVLGGGVAQLTSKSNVGPELASTSTTSTLMRSDRTNITTAVAFGLPGALSAASAHFEQEFIVETTTSGTAGTLTFQFALASAAGTPGTTQLLSSTVMIVQEVEIGT